MGSELRVGGSQGTSLGNRSNLSGRGCGWEQVRLEERVDGASVAVQPLPGLSLFW